MSTTPTGLPALPQGYQLDSQTGTSSAPPALPAGYKLDQPANQSNWGWYEGMRPFVNRLVSGVASIPHALNPAYTAEDAASAVPPITPVTPFMPINRMISGQINAEQQLLPQIAEQAKAGAESHKLDRGLPLPNLRDARTATSALSALVPFATAPVANVNARENQGQPSLAASEGLADATLLGGSLAAPKVVGPLAKTAARTVLKPIAPLLPKLINIEGVTMPVLAGEADPATLAGRTQLGLKAQGIRAVKFNQVAATQQAAVKQVIANVAQKTAGMTDLAAGVEPGPAMQASSDAVFSRARPMYQALDASMTSVPETADAVSQIVKQAQARAAKLGVEFNTPDPQEAVFQQAAKDYGLQGEAAGKLRTSMGLPEEVAPEGQPLQTALTVRSQLLKMARSSADPAMQRAIYQEADAMNASIEQALRKSGNPDLLNNWKNANSLWKKGYALSRVAESLDKAVSGTPVEQQVTAPGVVKQPPEINAESLVKELNALNSDGTLTKAMSPAQATALRQVADLLDRSQGTGVGKGYIKVSGYSPTSAVWHTVTDVVKSIGAAPFVKLMTSENMARAMMRLMNAQTPEAAGMAANSVRAQAGLPEQPVTPEANPNAQYAYRTRSKGEVGIKATGSRSQAGLDEAQIRSYMPGRESATGQPQEMIKTDLSRLPKDSYTIHSKNGFNWVEFHKDVPEHLVEPMDVNKASPGANAAHPITRADNAYHIRAMQELGANADPGVIAARVQQLKAQGIQPPAPPPSIVHRAATSAHPMTATQRAAIVSATMSQLKHGEIDQAEADRRIQRANGGGGRKLIRMPSTP